MRARHHDATRTSRSKFCSNHTFALQHQLTQAGLCLDSIQTSACRRSLKRDFQSAPPSFKTTAASQGLILAQGRPGLVDNYGRPDKPVKVAECQSQTEMSVSACQSRRVPDNHVDYGDVCQSQTRYVSGKTRSRRQLQKESRVDYRDVCQLQNQHTEHWTYRGRHLFAKRIRHLLLL